MTVLACVLAGCTAPSATGPSDRKSSATRLSVALDLADGVDVDQVTYTLTRPDGYRSSGTVPFAIDGNTFNGLLVLPVGRGYELIASAIAVTGAVCNGSANFDIWPDRKTAVSLRLECGAPARLGTASANGVVNICPAVQAIVVQPLDGGSGDAFVLRGAGTDADDAPLALSYAWSATSGVLTDATAASTSLRCTDPGLVTLTLTVSDGDDGCELAGVDVDVSCSGASVDAADANDSEVDAGLEPDRG